MSRNTGLLKDREADIGKVLSSPLETTEIIDAFHLAKRGRDALIFGLYPVHNSTFFVHK
jgi:hypothetical protein